MKTSVKIIDLYTAMREPEMLATCLEKANRYDNLASTVFAKPRNATNGYIEWDMLVKDGVNLVIRLGVVQRQPNAEFEFHS